MSPCGFLRLLSSVHGPVSWWSDDPYQVIVEAVLVQNTAWENVLAVRRSLSGKLSPGWLSGLSDEELHEAIRPCGFQKAKAACLRSLTAWFLENGDRVRSLETEQIRDELMLIRGVGRETADVILLYAFRRPVFVTDAYSRRILGRLGFSFSSDDMIRDFFEGSLGTQELGSLHWLILETGRTWCRKSPRCHQCPLASSCATGSAAQPNTRLG